MFFAAMFRPSDWQDYLSAYEFLSWDTSQGSSSECSQCKLASEITVLSSVDLVLSCQGSEVIKKPEKRSVGSSLDVEM